MLSCGMSSVVKLCCLCSHLCVRVFVDFSTISYGDECTGA